MIISRRIISHYRGIVAEARIIAQTRVIRTPPFPVFALAITVQPVVFNIVVLTLCQPLTVGVIVPVVSAAVIRIRAGAVPVLGTTGEGQGSKNQS
jgi:hypothetical protein